MLYFFTNFNKILKEGIVNLNLALLKVASTTKIPALITNYVVTMNNISTCKFKKSYICLYS